MERLWQFLRCWQSAVLTKGNFLKTEQYGALKKHELQGSCGGKLSITVCAWETPGVQISAVERWRSLFFYSPVGTCVVSALRFPLIESVGTVIDFCVFKQIVPLFSGYTLSI